MAIPDRQHLVLPDGAPTYLGGEAEGRQGPTQGDRRRDDAESFWRSLDLAALEAVVGGHQRATPTFGSGDYFVPPLRPPR